MECSAVGAKERRAWLKLTGQALWMMRVVVRTRWAWVSAARPSWGAEKSQTWGTILARWEGDRCGRRRACERAVVRRVWAAAAEGARTRQWTVWMVGVWRRVERMWLPMAPVAPVRSCGRVSVWVGWLEGGDLPRTHVLL